MQFQGLPFFVVHLLALITSTVASPAPAPEPALESYRFELNLPKSELDKRDNASDLLLEKRVYFPPSCIAQDGTINNGPCTCTCTSGYKLTASTPYFQMEEMQCQSTKDSSFYSPVGKSMPISPNGYIIWLSCNSVYILMTCDRLS